MSIVSQGLKELQKGGVWKLLRETKRAIPRRLFDRKTFLPYRTYFEYHTNKNRLTNRVRYDAPPEIYRPIHVTPTQVTHEVTAVQERDGLGQVKAGDWDIDENLRPLEKNEIVEGLRQRFKQGKSWKETVYYTAKCDDFSSVEEFLRVRCQFVEDLYNSIQQEGYRPNYKAGHMVPKEEKSRTEIRRYQHKLEPLVAIGRDGGIYWTDGFHRLAIAQILGLEAIPVQVVARHERWQQIRDKVHAISARGKEGELTKSVRNHPDMQDILC